MNNSFHRLLALVVFTALVSSCTNQQQLQSVRRGSATDLVKSVLKATSAANTNLEERAYQLGETNALRAALLQYLYANDYKSYLEKARTGDPYAQCVVGYCCVAGVGTERNYQDGVKWLTMSA
jgi:TPR repeat protein